MLFQKHHQNRDLIINRPGLRPVKRILLSTKRESVSKYPTKAVESCSVLFLKGKLPGLMIPEYLPVVLGVLHTN